MAGLPKRIKIIESNKTYKLSDFIGKSDEYIKNCGVISVLVDYETVVNNLDLLKRILMLSEKEKINCMDYESAVFLEENLDNDVILALVDDYENKDRSYIDVTCFTKHKLYIPLTYFMWGVKFEDKCNVFCLRHGQYDTMISVNGDEELTRETLNRIQKIAEYINSYGLSDVDKAILVSNYLQTRVQYVEDGFISHADREYYIEAREEEVTREKVGSLTSVINENYGLCMAIANATTLLLNNPILNVNVRSLYGDSHVWNIINIDGKLYYIDNTWAITRNKNRVEGALKATEFTDSFLLFGKDTASNIGHHNTVCYVNGNIENDDYSKEDIHDRVSELSKNVPFEDYPKTLRFKSRI